MTLRPSARSRDCTTRESGRAFLPLPLTALEERDARVGTGERERPPRLPLRRLQQVGRAVSQLIMLRRATACPLSPAQGGHLPTPCPTYAQRSGAASDARRTIRRVDAPRTYTPTYTVESAPAAGEERGGQRETVAFAARGGGMGTSTEAMFAGMLRREVRG